MKQENYQYFGKYRGKVTKTKDDLQLGRIQVEVPNVFDKGKLNWAMPCVPYAGENIGWFSVPPVGSNVWVEFEGGDPDYPIWSGCFWNQGELPEKVKVEKPEEVQLFKTDGITCTFSKFKGRKALTVEVETPVVERPLKMVFNADGIELNNNDETTIKLMAEEIIIDNRGSSTITVGTDEIQLTEKNVLIKLTGTEIDLIDEPSTVKLTKSAIELQHSASTLKLASDGIQGSNASANLKVAPASSELSNGAASVKLSPISVNVNNGALEVI